MGGGVSSDLAGAPRAGGKRQRKSGEEAGAKACWGGQDLFDSAMPASEQSAWNEMSSSWCCPSKGCSTALDTFMRNIRRASLNCHECHCNMDLGPCFVAICVRMSRLI
jgi:hypothetical protein